jgi:hypothetical protein
VNKFQKIGLAVAAAFGASFAAGDLWGPKTDDFPSLQVKVPDMLACWAENTNPSAENPCYSTTAGWWFAYGYAGGSAEVRKQGSWENWGQGVSLTLETDGSSLIDPGALCARLTAVSEDGTKYGGSAIGFNFKEPETNTENITGKGGYCITYSSDGPLKLTLGHDESVYTDECAYEYNLPAKSSAGATNLSWDQFDLPGWCKTSPPTGGKPVVTKDAALSTAKSLKIATAANQTQSAEIITLALYQFGWKDSGCNEQVAVTDCGGGGAPIISVRANAADVKFSMAGKVLSLFVGKAASVQIINLQGALVHSQALVASNNIVNLNSLPAGAYMVRIPALGYTSKILVK